MWYNWDMKKVIIAILMGATTMAAGIVGILGENVWAANYYCVSKTNNAVISKTTSQTDCVNVDNGKWVQRSTLEGLNYCIRSGVEISTKMTASECVSRGGTSKTGAEYLSAIDDGSISTGSTGSGSGTGSGTGDSGSSSSSSSSSTGSTGSGGSSSGGGGTTSTVPDHDGCVQSIFFDNTGDGRYCDDEKGGGIFMILGIVLDVLTYGVGILAVVGFVMVGIMYTTARDNEGQVAKAKERLGQIVIGLVIYALLYALLQFLIPGGVF